MREYKIEASMSEALSLLKGSIDENGDVEYLIKLATYDQMLHSMLDF